MKRSMSATGMNSPARSPSSIIWSTSAANTAKSDASRSIFKASDTSSLSAIPSESVVIASANLPPRPSMTPRR
jgi:hypothetical protein